MLIGFKIKNFRSFNELQYFSMIAGKVRSNENHIVEICNKKILKFSGIYGANGSGKSNLLLAIATGQNLIRNGIYNLINNQYFRGSNSKRDDDSYFEYEIAINNKLYSYGFEINIYRNVIVSEWLIDMTKNKEKIIFERDISNKSFKTDLNTSKHFNYANCLEDMKENNQIFFLNEMTRRLLLSKNEDNFFNDLISVYNFLINDTIIIKPYTHRIYFIDYIKNKGKIINILNKLDINISDIFALKSDINDIKAKLPDVAFNNLMNNFNVLSLRVPNLKCSLRINNDIYTIKKLDNNTYNVETLKFKHSGNINNDFGVYEESDGTIRILELIDFLLSDNKLFIIDELDSSLHPILIDGLLKMFLKENNNNQLIITTHESKTMDFDLIRRDEIWFTQKDNNGQTNLYSLEEYKDIARFDRKIDKAYLEGRFGAIANIKIN